MLRTIVLLQVRGLQRHELSQVRLVVSVDCRIVDLGGGAEHGHRQHEVAHLALLALQLAHAGQLGGRQEVGGADPAFELLERHCTTEETRQKAIHWARESARMRWFYFDGIYLHYELGYKLR
jgi:hypothetical protein